MIRRIPIVATLVVLIAVGIMIQLGFWQLDRRDWKEGLIARYGAAEQFSSELPWPSDRTGIDAALFRHSSLDCRATAESSAIAGRNFKGELGWAHLMRCTLPVGASAEVVLGWSRDPQPRQWTGGLVSGLIAPGGKQGARLLADPPLAGLEASARPDPKDLPNNHLAYAVQWFLFAGVALLIYVLAVRKRLAAEASPR
jgi:surfeit locus 1 family protein